MQVICMDTFCIYTHKVEVSALELVHLTDEDTKICKHHFTNCQNHSCCRNYTPH